MRQMHPSDDTYLIKQILAGNHRFFGQLVDKYQDRVYNFVFNLLRNEEESHEVVQDTFLKVFRSLGTFRNEAKFSTWMLRIAYFTCMTRLRKAKPDLVTIEHHAHYLKVNNVKDAADLADMRTILSQAMKGLSEEETVLVTLFYYNEQSIKEIGEITGLTESNVKVILHRSRKKLNKWLNKMGISEWMS